ncbi:hypothetical protein PIB30_041204 [Stylosanthes scabra]|uniref:Uncharacterized protein n=1 Tax=Stylosanthes scabra TaxID=79078 RepID=A0ABU6ZDK5_9FABA|nr:hypothetical protein [Stylosanthes scabra]
MRYVGGDVGDLVEKEDVRTQRRSQTGTIDAWGMLKCLVILVSMNQLVVHKTRSGPKTRPWPDEFGANLARIYYGPVRTKALRNGPANLLNRARVKVQVTRPWPGWTCTYKEMKIRVRSQTHSLPQDSIHSHFIEHPSPKFRGKDTPTPIIFTLSHLLPFATSLFTSPAPPPLHRASFFPFLNLAPMVLIASHHVGVPHILSSSITVGSAAVTVATGHPPPLTITS